MYAGRVAEEGPVDEVFRAAAPPVHPEAALGASRTSRPTGGPSRSSRARRRTCASRRRAAASRRAARSRCRSAPRSSRPRSRSATASASPATSIPPGSDGDAGHDGRRRTAVGADRAAGRHRRPTAPMRTARGGRLHGRRPRFGSRTSKVHFPIRGGFLDTIRAPAGRRRPGGRRHRPHPPPGRGPRAGRRIGQRQDHDRPGRSSSSPARRPGGSSSTAATSATCGASEQLRDYRRRVQIIFQDPYETLNPKQTIYDFVAEPLVVNDLGTVAAEREAQVARRARGGRAAAGRATSRSASRTSCRAASASGS